MRWDEARRHLLTKIPIWVQLRSDGAYDPLQDHVQDSLEEVGYPGDRAYASLALVQTLRVTPFSQAEYWMRQYISEWVLQMDTRR